MQLVTGEKVKVHKHQICVIGNGKTQIAPVFKVSRTKLIGIQVAFGFGEREFVGNIGEAAQINSGDNDRGYLF